MTKVSITTNANTGTIRRLKAMRKKVREMVADEIEASTFNIQDAASTNIKGIAFKKTTGNLERSGFASMDREKLLGQVGYGANYAPYIEFGTGTLVDIPEGLEQYAEQFEGQGIRQVNLPARPFLFPAFYAERPQLVERINSGLQRILS